MEALGEVGAAVALAMFCEVLAALFTLGESIGESLDGKGEWVEDSTSVSLSA